MHVQVQHGNMKFYLNISQIFNQVNTNRYVTLIGKLDEYILQLENAVNQLRQENQQLQQALQEKSKGSLPDETMDGFEE